MATAPRPTNVLRGLEKNATPAPKTPVPEAEGAGATRARRHESLLRRLDPAFEPKDDGASWEPRGTLAGVTYRDSMPTIPSPEVLESRRLAELAEAERKSDPAETERAIPRARAHFEPAHAPAVRVSPILELEKALPVIVDPMAIVSAAEPEPTPANAGSLQISVAVVVPPDEEALPDALGAESAVAAAVALQEPGVDEPSAESNVELEPEPSERSRITVPPARRRRRRRRLRALFLGALVLGGAAGAGWYRYPAECEQGWQRARAELQVWQSALQHRWALGVRGLGGGGTE